MLKCEDNVNVISRSNRLRHDAIIGVITNIVIKKEKKLTSSFDLMIVKPHQVTSFTKNASNWTVAVA